MAVTENISTARPVNGVRDWLASHRNMQRLQQEKQQGSADSPKIELAR